MGLFLWRRKWKKYSLLILSIVFLSLGSSIFFQLKFILNNNRWSNVIYHSDAENIPKEASFKSQNGQACVHPILSLWHPDMKKFFTTIPALKCSAEKDWIFLDNGHLYFDPSIKDLHGEIKCDYTPIIRIDDFGNKDGTTIENIKNGFKITSDFATVSCLSPKGKKYENIIAGISEKNQSFSSIKSKENSNSLDLNILMLGFDSVSRMTWMRNLPKTYQYFIEELKGMTLQGYNIVGDGTPQALLPILTGKTEIELPEARRGFAGAAPVDGHPWIWKMMKEYGFVTQYGEDGAGVGTFHYRMLGFKNQPTDHYMRHYQQKADELHSRNKPYCLGSQARHNIMFKWIEEFYSIYKNERKFSFLFHSEYTHGHSSQLQVADDDLLSFLKRLKTNNVLNNTVLILMSDHGARFQALRNTIQGKYEERMPYFSFSFPPWFGEKYPKYMKNFIINSQRLTSPFDIHETLRDIVKYKPKSTESNSRGISLFQEIPPERTCSHADIDNHWCACLKWQPISQNSQTVKISAEKLTEFINNLTRSKREDCHILSVQNITSAVEYVPQDKLLKFKKSKDFHGRVADLSDQMTSDEKYYQITIITSPNNGIYEGTVKYNTKYKLFTMNDKEISRINKYGSQPHCVMENYPHLRPYCYCLTSVSQNTR